MDNHSNPVIAGALALFPRGRFLMTACYDGQRSGMLVGSVQCCSTEPLLLCVAARKGHKIDPLIRDSRNFALGVVPEGDKLVMRRFSSADAAPSEFGPEGEDDPFDALPTRTLVTGAPVLPRCPTWFDCEVIRRVDLEAETELFVGMVVAMHHQQQTITLERLSEEHA